jgi:hypothetical protein
MNSLGCSATQSTPIITGYRAGPDVEGHSRQDPPGAAQGVSSPEGPGAETGTAASVKRYEPPRAG